MASLEDKLDVRKIAFAAAAVALIIVVIVIGLLALYKSAETDQFKSKVVDRPPREFTDLKLRQQGELNSYKWADRAAGVAAIPIDRAMDIVAAENQGAFGGPLPAQPAGAATDTSATPQEQNAPGAGDKSPNE